MCLDQLWAFFGCACGVSGGVASKQRSSYSAIIHLAQRQAAAALLTLSLWVAGYNSRWTAVDTGPHSHIPPWEEKWKGKGAGYEGEDKPMCQSYMKSKSTKCLGNTTQLKKKRARS